jgi:hypothetical protein|tara:strand:- start:390 stop:617 length:228 start_codon:yes stop_codon:yes gene_type:complete
MGIFQHENFILDLQSPKKGKLYSNGNLLFIGDGYKAIQILLSNCKDQLPVRTQFHNQLTMREKPKFTDDKKDDKK